MKARYRDYGLTAEQLRQRLRYDPETGVMIWVSLSPFYRKGKPGDIAGSFDNGYVRIHLDGHFYYGHCLAWLYMTGEWPKDQVDHRNGDRGDNRWENLREATNSTNQQNQYKASRNNGTGCLGMSRRIDGYRKKRFVARIMVDLKSISMGCFHTAKEAHTAYLAAKQKYHVGGCHEPS